MRHLLVASVLGACCLLAGCATAFNGAAALGDISPASAQPSTAQFASAGSNYSHRPGLPIAPEPEPYEDPPAAAETETLAETDASELPVDSADESPEQRAEAVQYAPPAPEPEVDDPVVESARQADTAAADEALAAQFAADVTVGDDVEPVAAVEIADVAVQGEEIATPEAEEISPFKPREDENDLDRFSRAVVDVPLDIRPTEGAMPHDAAATEFERLQAAADPRMSGDVPGIGCSYTPWTICFRPLYFEEQNVERYGYRVPVLQSAISGTAFLKNVAMLPYHMRVNPPRSCVCSNGFSRIGDCRPANYPRCVWRWDAVAVEMAAVTGFVFILP